MSRASPHDVVSINREAATKEERRRCAVCPMTASPQRDAWTHRRQPAMR